MVSCFGVCSILLLCSIHCNMAPYFLPAGGQLSCFQFLATLQTCTSGTLVDACCHFSQVMFGQEEVDTWFFKNTYMSPPAPPLGPSGATCTHAEVRGKVLEFSLTFLLVDAGSCFCCCTADSRLASPLLSLFLVSPQECWDYTMSSSHPNFLTWILGVSLGFSVQCFDLLPSHLQLNDYLRMFRTDLGRCCM